jgi:hypothetical protein
VTVQAHKPEMMPKEIQQMQPEAVIQIKQQQHNFHLPI